MKNKHGDFIWYELLPGPVPGDEFIITGRIRRGLCFRW
jgi:hypothetical protein